MEEEEVPSSYPQWKVVPETQSTQSTQYSLDISPSTANGDSSFDSVGSPQKGGSSSESAGLTFDASYDGSHEHHENESSGDGKKPEKEAPVMHEDTFAMDAAPKESGKADADADAKESSEAGKSKEDADADANGDGDADADADADADGDEEVEDPMRDGGWFGRRKLWGSRARYPPEDESPNTTAKERAKVIHREPTTRFVDGKPDYKRFRKNPIIRRED